MTAAGLLLGTPTAVGLGVLAWRWGVWRWLAVLAAVPALLAAVSYDGPDAPRDLGLVLAVTAAALAACWTTGRHLLPAAGVGLVVTGGALLLLDPTAPPTSDGALLVVLAVGPLLGLAAAAGLGRSQLVPLRTVTALAALVPPFALLAGWRDGGPTDPGALLAVAWSPVAGALGLTALLRGRRGDAVARPQADDHDAAALADLATRLDRPLAPVAIVIAAYNEAAGLPAVLEELPRTVCGLDVDVVVVDDGSADGTGDVVLRHGRAFLVRPGVNRGQGAALRLGYRVAREHGARYVISTDADGQYDPADMDRVLQPVVDGRADFVTGSRRLGDQETHDKVRRLGVHVFAWIVSGLTGHWTTDTSFGLRAMRADATGAVTLNQPQYQSSELMIGMLSRGFRVTEVPGRMRVRSAGASKKGRNLVYGSRYARVVIGTWWREGCPRPVTETAAALVDPRGRRTPEPAVGADAQREADPV